MRPRISIWVCVRRSVRPSVGRSVGPSLCNPFFLNAENEPFSLWKSSGQSNIDIAECAWCAGCAECAKCASCASYMCFIHVLHVLYMPMDASLACWALFFSYQFLQLIKETKHLFSCTSLLTLFIGNKRINIYFFLFAHFYQLIRFKYCLRVIADVVV
jgi:hypothetical protein